MARRTIKLPTTQQLEKLYKKGDIQELRKINERLAKTANQRMAQLFESNIKTSSALDRAQYYIYQESGLSTGGVFSRSKKLDPDKLLEQLKEELIFLRSPSSTVTGEKKVRALRSFVTLTEGKVVNGKRQDPYLTIPEDIKVPKSWKGSEKEYFQQKFLSFLDQDAWKDIKKYLYSTDTNILTDAGEAIARGAKLSDLRSAYNQYLRGEVDIYSMWDSWVSIT